MLARAAGLGSARLRAVNVALLVAVFAALHFAVARGVLSVAAALVFGFCGSRFCRSLRRAIRLALRRPLCVHRVLPLRALRALCLFWL